MANFTHEQEQAIFNHDKNLIVVAGAGSGKTRVLVERYLDLLDKNRDWRLNALVAITFTREAAFEMRDRVRKELENRVQHAPSDNDRRHWSRMLAQMDSARIDTIHGMCATILRANAAEAKVDPAFDVLEPIEASSALTDIIDAELQALADDDTDDIAPLFSEYDMRDIRDAISNQALLSVNLEAIDVSADELFEQWQSDWGTFYLKEIGRISDEFDDMYDWYLSADIPEKDALAEKLVILSEHWDDLFSDDVEASFTACQALADNIKWTGGAKSKWADPEDITIAKDILKRIREVLRELIKNIGTPPDDLDKKASEMLIRWYHLLHRVQTQYRAFKARDGYLDFDDLEQLTATLLANNPAVRARYQSGEFKRLLVDEFQDTNQAQWDIVRNLASLDDDVAMFLVGDPKQSIYAFRGADVSVFDGVRDKVGHHPNGQELDLTISFRSHPGLIEAFNALFSQILTRDEDSEVAAYEIEFDQEMSAFREDYPDPDAKHYSPIEFIIQRNYSRTSDDFVPSDDRRIWEAYEIGKRLQTLRTDEAPMHDKEKQALKPFDYGDAAILFQSTSHITTYEQVFKSMGIPFVTLAGRGYYNRQEVWDVLNLLKALHNPSDNLSLATALRSPMFGFSDEMLLALRLLYSEENTRRPIALWDALTHDNVPHLTDEQLDLMHKTRTILTDLRSLAGRVTISELLRTMLAKTGYLATLTGLSGGARLRRNIEKLVEIAEQSGKITLGAFSHYLDDLTAREVREGEATLDTEGVVRLMTVHASKGLEFPVVVLADAGWKRRNSNSAPLIYDDVSDNLACRIFDEDESKYIPSFPYKRAEYLQNKRDEAERKRLLYVAATRARDCLIISGEMRQLKSGDWKSDGWLETITTAIGLDSLDEVTDGYMMPYIPESTIRVNLPEYDDNLVKQILGGDQASHWEKLAIQSEADTPPLMQPIHIEPEKLLGHIAATQLANIGGYQYADSDNAQNYYRASVRRHVLDDARAQIREALRVRDPRVRPRQLGEVVHEALRYWRFPDENPNIREILRSYAWQQNITDEQQIQDVVERAERMLNKFQTSDLYQAIMRAKGSGGAYYSELPFILRTDKRVIHGVIDALFQHGDEWWVVDYKTSTVKGGFPNIDDHAKRYYLQLGAYASAVRQELGGITPRVFVHYIQYNKTVEVATSVWEKDIQRLEHYIGELIGTAND